MISNFNHQSAGGGLNMKHLSIKITQKCNGNVMGQTTATLSTLVQP